MDGLKILNVSGIDCYEKDGVVYLKLEAVARGLGFVQIQNKGGVEYTSIRWERVESYLSDIGFPHLWGKDDFIPENIFYRLAMKANNETAEKFQALVADEVIPSIRKTGTYSIQQRQVTDYDIRVLEAREKEAEARLAEARNKTCELMIGFWDSLNVGKQYQALALNGYNGLPSLPRESLAKVCVHMLDATTIASNLGIMSKTGNPHTKAVAAIIGTLELDEDEYAYTPYSRNGHDGVSIQYSDSVEAKVKDWLETNKYPTSISINGKSFTVAYKSKD